MTLPASDAPKRLFSALANGQAATVMLLVEQCGGPEQITTSMVNMTARRGHLKCLKMLKRSGVSLQRRDAREGWNPLDEAAARDHMEVVDWLLKQKLRLSERAPDGLRAVDRIQDEVFRQAYLHIVVSKERAQDNAKALNNVLPKSAVVKKTRF